MARSKSSHRWLQEHFSDPYVQQAHALGYRSRAVFKLKEIQEKDHIIRKGMRVLDLGAAPGGWSECAVQWVGEKGKIIALDILPMAPIAGVDFIQGDFTEEAVLATLNQHLNALGGKIDVLLSDMAPNLSGIAAVDQARVMYLADLAFDLVADHLTQGGDFLVKVFQGQEFDAYLAKLRQAFAKVVIRKPKSSRGRSKEVYLLARGYTEK